jgi:hypothetical protein
MYLACSYLVLDTKQRSLSLSQEGMALLFALLAEQPGVVFRWAMTSLLAKQPGVTCVGCINSLL